MIATPVEELASRANTLCARLSGAAALRVSVEASDAAIGGGSTPGITVESRALVVAVTGRSAHDLAAALRANQPPVIGRVADDTLWLDLRTVLPEQDDALAAALSRLAEA